jgi:hypothetical protein
MLSFQIKILKDFKLLNRNKSVAEYKYLGDKHTRQELRNNLCTSVKLNGKCIRGKNSNMLVKFQNGEKVVILARRLRKLPFPP